MVLPISFFERANHAYFNSLAMIDADGTNLGIYRKTHIPQGPGYAEKFYFSPGDTGFRVFRTTYAAVGVGICWDQWFPETARCLALAGADLLLFPTAIGSEPQDPSIDSSAHWRRTMEGHSAANIIPVIASNRIGREVFRTRLSAARAAAQPTPQPGALQAQQIRQQGLAAAAPTSRSDASKAISAMGAAAGVVAAGAAAVDPTVRLTGSADDDRARAASGETTVALADGAGVDGRPDAAAVAGQVVGATVNANGHRPAEDGADSLAFYGSTFITDQWGEVVPSAGRDEDRTRALPADGVIGLPDGTGPDPANAVAGGGAGVKAAGGSAVDAARAGVVGTDAITFYGSSFITDQWGEVVVSAGRDEEAILSYLFDLDVNDQDRRQWGLFRDRRPEMYRTLLSLDGHSPAGGAGLMGVAPMVHGAAPAGAGNTYLPPGVLPAGTAGKQQPYVAGAAAPMLPLGLNRALAQTRPPFSGPPSQLFPNAGQGHNSQMGVLMLNQPQRLDAAARHGGAPEHHGAVAATAGLPAGAAVGLMPMQQHGHTLAPARGAYPGAPNQLFGTSAVSMGSLLMAQQRGEAAHTNGQTAVAAAAAAAAAAPDAHAAAAAAAAAAGAGPASASMLPLPLQTHQLAPSRTPFTGPPAQLFPTPVPGAQLGSLLLPQAPGAPRDETVVVGVKSDAHDVTSPLAPATAVAAAVAASAAEAESQPPPVDRADIDGGAGAGAVAETVEGGIGSGRSGMDANDATAHEASFIGEVRDSSQRRPRGRCWSCRAKTTYECKKCVPGPVPLCNRVPRECWWKYHAGEVTPFVPSRRGRKRKAEDDDMPMAAAGDAAGDYGSGAEGAGDSGSAGADASIGDIGQTDTNDGDESLAVPEARVVA